MNKNKKIYEILKILGNNIQQVRKNQNVTITELAEKTGISKKYITKIEEGDAIGMCAGHLFKIAIVLHINPSCLLKSL